jgi:hypothetical protein
MTTSRTTSSPVLVAARIAALACVLVTGIGAGASSALAAPDASPQASSNPQVPFDEGRELMRAGRFGEAAEKFEASLAIRRSTGALLNVADCYEKLGRYGSAAARFEEARTSAEESGDRQRAEEARTRRAALMSVVSRLTVRAPSVNGVRISVDDRTVAAGEVVLVDGGAHRVTVSAPCKRSFERQVIVGIRGDVREIVADLAPDDRASCAAPKAAASRGPSDAESSWWTPRHGAGVGLGAAGAVALGLSGLFGVEAMGAKSDIDGACPSYPHGCASSDRARIDDLEGKAEHLATASTISLVVGVLFLAGGAYLVLTGSKPPATTTAREP